KTVRMSAPPGFSSPFSNNFSNDTGYCVKESSTENILLGSYYVIAFLLSFVGNAIAVWIFICQRITGSPANILLMHLAIADLCYATILPMKIVYHLKDNHWPFGDISCRFTGFLFFLNIYASLFFMTCISVDRFLAVVYPVWSIKIRKPLTAHVVSIFLWVLLACSMIPLLRTSQTPASNATICPQLYREKASRKALVSLTLGFAIPFFITVSSYLAIIHSFQKGSQSVKQKHLKNRVTKMIILVLIHFILCFAPYHINRFIYILSYNGKTRTCGVQRALLVSNRITSCLTSLSPALDPIMYFFLAEKFKEALNTLICNKSMR
uniref:Si:dkey-96n2.3 n=1 Tax=Latimeria chalumnae TaxID=7897 RepID=H3ARJ9_LATCH